VNTQTPLLSELFRPQIIDDLALAEKEIGQLKQMLSQGSIMNLLFHGKTGTGKTTACTIILKAISPENGVKFSGSATWNVDLLSQIDMYACTQSVLGGRNCLIDDVDLLSKPMQNALRGIIDKTSKNRFLFTANDIRKVIPAIQSRALLLSFDVAPLDCAEVRDRI
jgi:DNA polymerase III delta prime subunit